MKLEQVKAARALLAWSQADLARQAEVAVSTVADFERRHRSLMASGIAAEVGLHQTYVAAILKTLEAEGRLVVFGRRTRIYS